MSITPKAAIKDSFTVKQADLYARPRLTLSVEFFPPKTDKGEENLFSFSEIAGIKRLTPAFCSVAHGAGGSMRKNQCRGAHSSRVEKDARLRVQAEIECANRVER
jgi:methylenetetrahydrofolate reductase (NADPH)